MEVVAETLRDEAVRRTDVEQKDQFGRSAYNRFYYTMFLIAREMVVRMGEDWKKMGHANYPPLLRGQVCDQLRKGRKEARRLEDWELDTQCAAAISAASDLAALMKTGSATRVVADYEPHVPVLFTKPAGFSLQAVSVSDALDWPRKARALCAIIERAWWQLDHG